MSDEINSAPAEQAPAEQQPETLESLYNQYQIPEQQAPMPTQQEPVQSAPVQHQSEPQEPISEDNLNAALLREVQQIRQERANERAAIESKQADDDFNAAVTAIGKEAGLEGKDKLIKGYMLGEALSDNRLRLLFDKRHTNPQQWGQAQKVIAKQIAKEFSAPNPQLVENQAAMEKSQKAFSSEPPQRASAEEEVLKLGENDFQRLWRGLTQGRR